MPRALLTHLSLSAPAGVAFRLTTSAVVLLIGLAALPGEARALDSTRDPRALTQESWSQSNGLPPGEILALLPTSDGQLWLGTTCCVVRYDGTNFTTVHRGDRGQEALSFVRDLIESPPGIVWAGAAGGLARIETDVLAQGQGGNLRLFAEAQGLAHPYIYSLLSSQAGPIVGTGGTGAFWWTGRSFLPLSPSGKGPLNIYSLVRDGEDQVWAGTDSGLWRFLETTQVFEKAEGLGSQSIHALAVGAQGALWISTESGIYFRAPESQEFVLLQGTPPLAARVLLKEEHGPLWLGAGTDLYRFVRGNSQLVASFPKGIGALALDGSSGLWVGSGDELIRLTDGAFEHLVPPTEVAEAEPLALETSKSGVLWAVFDDGSVWTVEGHDWHPIWPKGTVSGRGMLGLSESAQGDLLVAGEDLVRLSKDGSEREIVHEGAFALVVKDEGGLLLVQTDADGTSRLYRSQNGELTEVPLPQPMRHIQRLFRDSTGALWISSGGTGLLKLGAEGHHHYTAREGLPSDTVYGIAEDRAGRLWVATRKGLALVRPDGSLKNLAGLSCTPQLSPIHLQVGESETLWVTADDGVHVLSIDQLARAANEASPEAECHERLWGKSDGLPSLTVSWRAGGQARLGERVCYATSQGIACASLKQAGHFGVPPQVRIDRLLFEGSEDESATMATTDISVDQRKRPFRIDFSTIDLNRGEDTEIRTRLAGFDATWSEPTSQRSVRYTNLPVGRYIFEASARYQGGPFQSKPTSITIHVAPYWYETVWGRLVVGCSLVLFASAGVWLFQRRLRRNQRHLEQLVSERTQAYAEQVEETQALARDLDQRVRERTEDLERSKRALTESQERYALAVAGAEQGVWDWDCRSGDLYLSPQLKAILGDEKETMPSTMEAWTARIHPLDREAFLELMMSGADHSENIRLEHRIALEESGEVRWVLLTGVVLVGPGGVERAAGSLVDISAQKQLQDELSMRATHDHLTGLPNRALFTDRLEQSLLKMRADGGGVGVVLFNIDRFRSINERFALSTGDGVLQTIAERAPHCLKETESLARLGSNEFAVLLPEANSLSEVEQRLAEIAAQVRAPMNALLGDSTPLTLSAGYCWTRERVSADQLLRDTTLALEQARGQGGDRSVAFSAQLRDEHEAEVGMVTTLRRALDEGHFELFYQPIVTLASNKPKGVEALIRLNDPKRGLLSPGQFMATAEASGLLLPMSHWVLSAACAQIVEWNRYLPTPVRVSINLAPEMLFDPHLFEIVMGEVERHGILPEWLGVEILETSFVRSTPVLIENLSKLRDAGVEIAIDDFGTGYSSFGYLSKLPVTTLKLDRSLIQRVPEDTTDAAICRALVGMAGELGLQLVVEGVERQEQAAFFRELHCGALQGYYFSRPLQAEACGEYLHRLSSTSVTPSVLGSQTSGSSV